MGKQRKDVNKSFTVTRPHRGRAECASRMVFKLVVKRALMAEGAIHFDLGAVFHLFLVALETVLRVVAESAEFKSAGQVGVEQFDGFLRHIG